MNTVTLALEKTIEKRGLDWIRIARELWKIKKIRKEAQEKEKMLLEALIEKSERKSSTGGGFKFDHLKRMGSIPYKDIPAVKEALKDVNIELYRGKKVDVWKLSKI